MNTPITQAIGLSAALAWVMRQNLEGMQQHLWQLTERALAGLKSIDPMMRRIRILGPSPGEQRLPLISFVLKEAHPHDICQVMNDRHGVALRGGFHCAQPLHDFMGIDGSTRASFAAYNSMNDVDAFLTGVEDCMALLC
jgi:cysteine desulfurase/selenocysteine lyase